ncbi:hypothetical protein [Phocaeicola dorei]|uniref:hypothetical protein n=1 Tax=Phocaeicola dorei TaxID=357276 RepID=UPI0032EADFD5
MSTYSYKNPKFINSPKGVVEVVEVIYDGKDDPAYSLAIIKWAEFNLQMQQNSD